MSQIEYLDRPAGRPSEEPFLSRVRIRNYKSIGACDVSLSRLTVLVGRNGAGKSNFLDALRFVADGLQTSLDHALKARGGIDAVRRRSTGHPRDFAIQIDVNLPEWCVATYGFEIGARPKGGFRVKRERLVVRNARNDPVARYRLVDGKVMDSSEQNMPPVLADRLYLVTASGLPQFRPVFDALVSMGFYNLNPQEMKELQNPDAGELLHRDGANIASVIARLSADQPGTLERVKSYLGKIVSGVKEVERVPLGPKETLEFRQEVEGSKHPWQFYAGSMSDGTLRALGALVAATQLAGRRQPVTLIGIEEPETALHPAAAGALMDALREATAHTQVLLTSHSPDLLDQIDPSADGLFAVQARGGTTEIAPVDPTCLDSIRSHLYTPGEFLRMDQLEPDGDDLKRQKQMTFDFDGEDV